MDRQKLREILSSNYDQQDWIELLKDVFHTGELFQRPQPLPALPGNLTDRGFQLGKFETKDGYDIGIFEVHLKENVALHRNRVGVRNLLGRYYKQLDGVFAVFKQGSTWRFSFISQLRDWDNEQEEWVLKETEPKRFTYLLGEGEAVKTATDRFHRLLDADSITFEDIKEAFSVERLNKEFYKKVVSFFYDLLGVKEPGRGGTQHPHWLALPNVPQKDKQTHQEFAVRLIGRIVFCWFLKFKQSEQGNPIIPEEALSTDSICEDYYHQKLERLFFQVLNTQKEDRRDDLPGEYEAIPFLNGGLFEPHRQDYFKPNDDTGISEHLNTLKIRDEWFQDLFGVLEQYNFTIDENSVEDADVSVDPEMLGRIFENLLAEIDPASGDSARKATGSYYTPREIVDYMVDESLNKYLHKQTGIEERRLLPLFKFDDKVEHKITDQEKHDLIHALNNIKVLDPACGSGAFPMGILQKMVRVLEKVDPDSERWKELQLAKIPSAIIRRMVRKRLEDATVEYARKLGIIQHSIYGVDIQPIAAEISKLRCFLSLAVDEQVNETKDNWNIEPLPNLEFKFLAADSLQSLPKEDSQTVDLFGSSDLLERLGNIRDDYLQAYGEDKAILKEQFEEVQKAILAKELKGTGRNKSDRAIKLSSWEPFSDSVTGWFDPEWMFGVEQFDVVLGNPPYGGEKISHNLKNEMNLGSRDPYGAFLARFLPDGFQKSPLADEGLLCFIVSDTFMTIKTHHELREKMMDNYIHKMIRVHKDTFGATVNTAITLCERNEFPIDEKEKKKVRAFDEDHTCLMADLTQISIHKEHDTFINLLDRTVHYDHPLQINNEEQAEMEDGVLFMRNQGWTIESSGEYAFYTYSQALINRNRNKSFFVASPNIYYQINARLENKENHVMLSDLMDDVCSGVKTYNNKKYLKSKNGIYGYEAINEKEKYDGEINKSLMKGIDGEDCYLPFEKGGESVSANDELNHIYRETDYYIKWDKKSIEEIDSVSGLRNKDRYFEEGISFSESGFYSPVFRYFPGHLFANSAPIIFFKDTKQIHYILGILVSKVIRYYLKNYLNHTVHTLLDDVRNIPVLNREYSDDFNKKIRKIVREMILELKNDDTIIRSDALQKINHLVYEAYGLDDNDIREIENWYARRYPKLVKAQKENLAAQGKPTDYLELYAQLEEETLQDFVYSEKQVTDMKEFGLHTGIYSVKDAVNIINSVLDDESLKVSNYKVRSWFRDLMKSQYEGLEGSEKSDIENWRISFHGLIELYVIGVLRDNGFSLQKVLQGREALSDLTGKKYPFATNNVKENLKVAGNSIEFTLASGDIVTLNGTHQFNLKIIKEFFQDIVFDTDGIAEKILPGKGEDLVVISPKEGGGKPVVREKGILVETISSMYQGQDSVGIIMDQYDLEEKEVRAALNYSESFKN